MMTNSASLLLVELERLADRAPAGRASAMRNEACREWQRQQRMDTRASSRRRGDRAAEPAFVRR
jgi:hypothetical protein